MTFIKNERSTSSIYFNNVLRNTFAKQVYDTKKRGDVHAACENVSYNFMSRKGPVVVYNI